MNLIRNAVQSNASLRLVKQTVGLPSYLRQSPRCFSTETGLPPRTPLPPRSSADAPVNQFLQTESSGFWYAKLIGGSKFAMKSDVIHLLDGCNLTPDDIKLVYSSHFEPVTVRLLRFPSPNDYNIAARTTRKLGGFRLDRIDPQQWEGYEHYDGTSVVLEGIPRNASIDDIERFLSGCEDYVASSFTLFNRGPVRFVGISYPSQIQAMNCFIRKDRALCLNDKISVRVLN